MSTVVPISFKSISPSNSNQEVSEDRFGGCVERVGKRVGLENEC